MPLEVMSFLLCLYSGSGICTLNALMSSACLPKEPRRHWFKPDMPNSNR
ncbi:uncharacterized protein ARMOST_04327 [Armillaria ostoyae]|uniref:Uncharacterized protein n=1 Tax=Armillaria ostoyae TaxID=47428 RepID=A0A284QX12_ARMOS|nr:uncharacterized protein ARMOST_04327 [Armillaria ostoyae]